MALSDYNVNYDEMQKLIMQAESEHKDDEKKEFKELEDGVYVAEIDSANFAESKTGKPMLKLVYRVKSDKDDTVKYNQKAWDCTIVAGTKNDGYMCWLATKKLNKIYHGFDLSGDWDNDNVRLERDWLPHAKECEFYVEIKTNKQGYKQYTVIDVWDK